MPEQINPKLWNWASDTDEGTLMQAAKTSRLPIVEGHVALMPDAHVGIGSTVGSVIPTKNAIIPSCVGVDIGCGMVATETSITADQLPDDMQPFLSIVEQVIPAGVGRGHSQASDLGYSWMRANIGRVGLTSEQERTAVHQFGSLGSGNHFFEVCLDERDRVWLLLHSGSRGIGNQLARGHIKLARTQAREAALALEDLDLAYFMQGTPEFRDYIRDVGFAQHYGTANRSAMMGEAIDSLFKWLGFGEQTAYLNCHHNFTALESHGGQLLWVTRKGAIRAEAGDYGVIPGSMGTRSYIVQGKGNPNSYNSCSHGAGRRYSRTQARKVFTTDDLAEQMQGKAWLSDRASDLLDEIPSAYKDVDQVMADQTDLVEIKHTLTQILNYKGV